MDDKAESVTSTLMKSTLVQYFGIFGLYLPVTYILAGALADIVSQQWRVSGASLSALIAVVLNFIGHRFADYMGSTSSKMQSGILSGNAGNLSGIYSGCTVPGFEGFESMLAPQSLVIIFAMTTFFFIDIKQNYSGQSISGLIGLTAVATLVQIFVLMNNACWTPDFYASWIPNKTLMLIPILFAGVFGVVGAGIGYLINNAIKKALLLPPGPTATSAVFCPAGQTRKGTICCPTNQVNDRGQCAAACATGWTADSSGVCQQPSSLDSATRGGGFGSALPPVGGSDGGGSGSSSDDQFVCEAYKNGELVTSTITE
jgi:hypothetical protein